MAKRYEDMAEAPESVRDLVEEKSAKRWAKDALDMQLMSKGNDGQSPVQWHLECCGRIVRYTAKGDILSISCSVCGLKQVTARRIQSRTWTRWVLAAELENK